MVSIAFNNNNNNNTNNNQLLFNEGNTATFKQQYNPRAFLPKRKFKKQIEIVSWNKIRQNSTKTIIMSWEFYGELVDSDFSLINEGS